LWSGVNQRPGADMIRRRDSAECWSVKYKDTKKLEST
jgi:hypothetical protein